MLRGQREDTPVEKLGDLLTKLRNAPGGVRIFVHEYHGAVDEEVVTGRRGKPVSVQAIADTGLPEDLVMDVAADAG